MMLRVTATVVCLWTLLVPRPALAWGFVGHRLIMQRAIDLLPPDLKPFFQRYRDEVVSHVVDPDLWRNVGWQDDPNHFIDFGVPEYGRDPFAELPREYGAAIEKFGMPTLTKNGLLPWRLAEQFGALRRGFEEFKRSAPYTASNTALFASVLSHYVQDAHQPFHATDNFDGQLTGQGGLHARFERDLFERYGDRLTLAPPPLYAVPSARDFAFDTLVASYRDLDLILRADKAAIAGREAYDDQYFEVFFREVRPLLERRVSAAATATASVIVAAWERAGRPALRLEEARPLQRPRPAR